MSSPFLTKESFEEDISNVYLNAKACAALAEKYAGCYFSTQVGDTTAAYWDMQLVAWCSTYFILEITPIKGVDVLSHPPHCFEQLNNPVIVLKGWGINPTERKTKIGFYYIPATSLNFIRPGRELTEKEKKQLSFKQDLTQKPLTDFMDMHKNDKVIYKTNKYSNLKGRKYKVQLVAALTQEKAFIVKFVDTPSLSSLRVVDLMQGKTKVYIPTPQGIVRLDPTLYHETGYWIADKNEIIGLAND